MNTTRVLDVSDTPTVGFGARDATWWAQWGMIAIEGTMFGLLWASYLYLHTKTSHWPPAGVSSPFLIWSTANTLVFLLSIAPNQWLKRSAERGSLKRVRIGLTIMAAIALVNSVVRVFEFSSLNCSWNANAYGSIVWTIIGFHTFHLGAQLGETLVLLLLMLIGPLEGKRFNDVSVGTVYWYFVVASWLPSYLLVYWLPRWN